MIPRELRKISRRKLAEKRRVERARAGHRTKSGKLLHIAVLCCFSALFLISTYMIINYVAESKRAGNSYSDLQIVARQASSVPSAATNVSTAPEEAGKERELAEEVGSEPVELRQMIAMDFSRLKEINPDIIGWIRLEGTSIDYPIVRTDNNDYYLDHLYNGEWNSNGSIFIDYRNTGDFTDRNTVIYGHHMKNGMMFHALEKYKHQEFYDANPTMTLLTPDGDYTVELICGTIEDGNSQFVEFDFDSEDTFNNYMEGFRSRSTFVSDVELQPGDRIVSLCTCSYERANARYMVIGRLVPIMVEAD